MVWRLAVCTGVLLALVQVAGQTSAVGQTAEEHYNQGTVLLKAGKTADAIAEFQQAVKVKPDLAAAHFNLGQAYEKQGGLDQAIAAYREAIRCKAEGKYYQSLGLAYKKKKMLPEAIEAGQKATQLDPTDPKAFYNLANACAEKDSQAAAVANYEKALELRYPRPADVYLNLGIARQKQGQVEPAVAAYQAYLKAAPRAANAAQIQQVIDGLRQR